MASDPRIDTPVTSDRSQEERQFQYRSNLSRLSALLKKPDPSIASAIEDCARHLLRDADATVFQESSEILTKTCFFLFEIGRSHQGIRLGLEVADFAKRVGERGVERKICNIVGGQYADIADFASSLKYLETAIVLARGIGDSVAEAACLANVVAVLQEMGHYRQAIALAERVLRLDDDSVSAANFKLQCASNGLFAAHRVGDSAAALRFLSEGQRYLSRPVNVLRLAFFERGRVLYYVDHGDASTARVHLDETVALIGDAKTERISILLSICNALCAWGSGNADIARDCLQALYEETSRTRFYHHFVLQALVKVFSNAESQAGVTAGLSYARELVEFTTSVKKAKFYRQLKNNRSAPASAPVESMPASALAASIVGPFAGSNDWLNATNIGAPAEGEESARRELAKHEELTAIHDDMARLRLAGLRREIRTDAVDTAENWAIAAEFFDDETGTHCYRVGHLASMLAREIGMDDEFCMQIEHAARLHDIGKIAVNEVILLKPGPLDATEMAAMRLHTEVGAQILAGSDDPTLKMAVDVARHHHEWWNGNGYPRRLSARDIPIAARISAYADVYDALTHARAYKKAWTHERAIAEIARLAGVQFDPDLLAPFTRVLDRYLVDLAADAIPGFVDMDSNALISSRRKLMETISATN